MKYWTYCEPDENDNTRYVTLSEDEILKEYWEYWYGRMCLKFGKVHVDETYCQQDCIDDWTIVHWAWTDEEVKL